jgi:hypothetical protein
MEEIGYANQLETFSISLPGVVRLAFARYASGKSMKSTAFNSEEPLSSHHQSYFRLPSSLLMARETLVESHRC